ncbi:hypothetical protein GGX14DRAFT_451047, partial [Mycena pura]
DRNTCVFFSLIHGLSLCWWLKRVTRLPPPAFCILTQTSAELQILIKCVPGATKSRNQCRCIFPLRLPSHCRPPVRVLGHIDHRYPRKDERVRIRDSRPNSRMTVVTEGMVSVSPTTPSGPSPHVVTLVLILTPGALGIFSSDVHETNR